MRAFVRLLLRGAITTGMCAVAALCIAGFLSLIANSLQPKKQTIGEPAAFGCVPSHCRSKAPRHQVVVAKVR
jgi:hypothetical protein